MKTVVSQRTMLIDGVPACPRCGRRPRKPIPESAKRTRQHGQRQGQGRRWYGYCAICGPEVERLRRQNLVQLTAAEAELIRELRAAKPAGKHHATT